MFLQVVCTACCKCDICEVLEKLLLITQSLMCVSGFCGYFIIIAFNYLLSCLILLNSPNNTRTRASCNSYNMLIHLDMSMYVYVD